MQPSTHSVPSREVLPPPPGAGENGAYREHVTPLLQWAILFFLVAALTVPAHSQPSTPDAQPELIVRLAESAPASLQAQLQGTQPKTASPLFEGVLSVQSAFPETSASKSAPSSGFQAYVLSVEDSTRLRSLLRQWGQQESVAYVQENTTFQLNGGEGSRALSPGPRTGSRFRPSSRIQNLYADSLDHLNVIRARDAWSVTRGAKSVRIGIVDSGIYLDHPDLQTSLWVNEAEDLNGNGRLDGSDLNGVDDDGNGFVDDVVGYDFVDRPGFYVTGEYETRDPDPSPDPSGPFSGHGTTVAGVAAAHALNPDAGIDGVAPEARFVPLRAFAADGRGQTDDIAAAIVYAASQGFEVLNLSFGRSRPAPLIEEAIRFAIDQGTVVVGSAGNELTDEPHYPSDYEGVISVVWLAEDGEGLPTFNRSQFGIRVDLGAPGTDVFTTQFPRTAIRENSEIEADDLYGNATGSSFSAPQVAGAAALLRSVDPDLTPASVRTVLTTQADDLERESWDHTTGAGRLDVADAVRSTLPGQTAIAFPAHNDGFDGSQAIPVVGTVLDPSFASYSVYYARGTTDLDEGDPWTRIAGPIDTQAYTDTLTTWDVRSLPSGTYTLRLKTTLRTGQTIEDRRRVVLDDTPPALTVRFLGAGMIHGQWGVVSDLEADDPSRLTLQVEVNGASESTTSEFVARRQGLNLPDPTGDGGLAQVRIEAVNRVGLSTVLDTTIQLPASTLNTAYFNRETARVPRGRLLPQPTDFDGDGSAEVVFNQLEEGGISDTLRSFEWTPDGFAPADTLIANVIPKDVGDPEDDGRANLLTQIAAVTLLLEQGSPDVFPTEEAFVDTTGINDPGADDALIGTLLTDLDGDNAGEIVGNNQREWRVLEWNGASYEEILRLGNPTAGTDIDSVQNANRFGTAAAADGDFDADGRRDLLVGDRDGDWILYEGQGPNAASPVWTFETHRFDAGNRFGTADWDGDGTDEFITFSTYFPLPIEPGEFEPPMSFYHVWDATGDDAYERVFRLPVTGEASGQGAIAAADFDEDGRDELVVTYPPSLYVLDYRPTAGWEVVYHDASSPSVLGRGMVAADLDANGQPELLAATTGDSLSLYRPSTPAIASPPPKWRTARPTGADGAVFRWEAPGADSVTVYAGRVGASLDPVQTVTDSTLTLSTTQDRTYALRAWRGGSPSPFSQSRRVRPHPPAQVTDVSYPTPASVQIRFTEGLDRQTRADQFALNSAAPAGPALLGEGGATLTLRFDEETAAASETLSWTGVRDSSGLAVGQTSVPVSFPDRDDATLIVRTFTIVGEQQVRIQFSEALDEAAARDLGRYRLRPTGQVADVSFSREAPQTVTLSLEGIVIGASGRETSLEITSMQSRDGSTLADNAGALRLSQPADNLANVFVYPNPYRTDRHGSRDLTVAGLPPEATVRIFSRSGQLVRVLATGENRTGGRTWNLRNERGELVPSGVYLVRVEAPDQAPVLKKAAVIR